MNLKQTTAREAALRRAARPAERADIFDRDSPWLRCPSKHFRDYDSIMSEIWKLCRENEDFLERNSRNSAIAIQGSYVLGTQVQIRTQLEQRFLEFVSGLAKSFQFTIPEQKEAQPEALTKLLSSLDAITDPQVLQQWLEAIVAQRVRLPMGLLGDSPALAILKRLMKVDFKGALTWFERVFDANENLPFRRGFFQISIVGAMTVYMQDKRAPRPLVECIEKNIEILAQNRALFGDSKNGTALLAALFALLTLVGENSSQPAAALDSKLKKMLDGLDDQSARFFRQFFADCLAQFLTEENLPRHCFKFIRLARHFFDDSILWPQSQSHLIKLLRGMFPQNA